jgi:hypothetical protein
VADEQALVVVSRPATLFAIASKLEHGNQVTRNEKTYRLATTVPLDRDWRIARHGGDGVRAEGFYDLATFVSRKVEQVKYAVLSSRSKAAAYRPAASIALS